MAVEFERVHNVVIEGNTKTKNSVIEAEIGCLRDATTLQDLFQAASCVRSRLHALQIFDSVNVTFSPGPPELPGTANVVVQVSELRSPLRAKLGVFTKPGEKSSLEGSVHANNMFGYGDLWAGSMGYGNNQSEMSMGVNISNRLRWFSPMGGRLYLQSHDWQQLLSLKQRSVGASIDLLSTKNHHLPYDIAWRTLMDPSKMASTSIRRQVGHNLLSSLKYSYKNDCRDSTVRPTTGYCFASSTELGLKSLRQDFDVRYAVPLGISGAALNLGVSGDLIFPWSKSSSVSVCERYFLGGKSSPVRALGGPTSLFGFQSGEVGPTDLRRRMGNDDDLRRDVVGGDIGVTAFADVSFDLPSKYLKDAGIYGHVFASAGSLAQLQTDYKSQPRRDFSLRDFYQSLRTSVGLGLVIPTKLFTMEANLCYVLKQHEHDNGKSGLEFSFSSPSS